MSNVMSRLRILIRDFVADRQGVTAVVTGVALTVFSASPDWRSTLPPG